VVRPSRRREMAKKAVIDTTCLLNGLARHLGSVKLTCLVLSDHFHLETKAPVVELLFHPETYSSGV
jgi:hypothetical protein